jgi:hypothetical protein
MRLDTEVDFVLPVRARPSPDLAEHLLVQRFVLVVQQVDRLAIGPYPRIGAPY